jgi:hypothetical protein
MVLSCFADFLFADISAAFMYLPFTVLESHQCKAFPVSPEI